MSTINQKDDFMEKAEVEPAHKSINIPDDFVYNATTTAVPKEVIQYHYERAKGGKLHKKRPGQSVRREMTERRISNNIQMYNSAMIIPDTKELFIGQSQQDYGFSQNDFAQSNMSIGTQQDFVRSQLSS